MDCGADLPDCKYEKVNPNLAYMESLDRKALREELVTVIRMLTGQPPAIKGELTAQSAEA